MMKYLRPRGGFTLIEMLVVVVIIAVLVAISIPALFQSVRDARTRTCSENIRQLENAAALYASQNAGHTPLEDGITAAGLGADVAFFPDGPPTCPFGIGYTWSAVTTAEGLVDKVAHYNTWPDDHI